MKSYPSKQAYLKLLFLGSFQPFDLKKGDKYNTNLIITYEYHTYDKSFHPPKSLVL